MQNDEMIVTRTLNVDLDQVHADAQSGRNGEQSVAGRVSGGAAMANAKNAHEPIMTDSSTGEDTRIETDPAWLAESEAWYREHCKAILEICIVSLEAHRHAIIVPNFVLLKEQRHANARELLRFEFQELSKQRPVAERPDTFSLRPTPLPRKDNGEPDRGQLRIEIAERPGSSAKPVPLPAESAAESIAALIRAFRPDAVCERNANLELDLGFDSLDRLLLIASVEKTFDLSIPDDQAARILSVDDLIDAVQQRPQASPDIAAWAEILGSQLDGPEQSLATSILKQRPGLTFLAWALARLLRLLLGHRFRFEVHGGEWVLPEGPYLMVANHCSHLDPLFLLWALPYRVAKRLSFMGHTEYFGSGWKAALAKRLKLVPVDSDEHARSGIRLSAEALRRGMIGMVFPEGERSANGAQQRFHRGAGALARELDIPILPVAICGTWDVLPRGREKIRYAPVQVRFGSPLCAQPAENDQDVLARVWEAVRQLRGVDARAREPIPGPLAIHWKRIG